MEFWEQFFNLFIAIQFVSMLKIKYKLKSISIAIHGTCYGTSNMLQSGDIMGYANYIIESTFGGYSMFINGIFDFYTVCKNMKLTPSFLF